ncbi:hypothetical protein CPC08DRAFT_770375 [Agrocybe pediades]|nr:hypothetical protein CPC08DRAFT_770375 [Agrocybe pediades]
MLTALNYSRTHDGLCSAFPATITTSGLVVARTLRFHPFRPGYHPQDRPCHGSICVGFTAWPIQTLQVPALKQELKKGKEMVPTMPDDAQAQSARIPVGLIEEAEIRHRMVGSGGDEQQLLEQNAASGSHAPAVVAMRLDEIERRMRSLETSDAVQNQIGELDRPPPEYTSTSSSRNIP